MSTFLTSLPKQPTSEGTAITASYDVNQVSDVEPRYALKQRLHKNFRTPLSETEQDISDLLTWQEGWDGYDAPKPKYASIDAACAWVRQLYRDVRGELWIKPHISADDGGEVSFEWWKGRKKLTVYISPKAVEYIKVEKVGPSPKMEDGLIETPRKRRELWNWLIS